MNDFTHHSSRWLKNIGYLSVLRMVEYVLPLVTFPIVVRVLGPEIYGKWVYAQVLVSFFALGANLGLISYGQREIAVQGEMTKELVPSILSLRLCLSLITYGILAVSLVFLRPDSTTLLLILLFGLTLIINAVFSLDWIFVGFQRFDRLSILQSISQAVMVIGIIMLLHDANTVWVLPILVCGATVLAGLYGWRWLQREGVRFKIRFTPNKWWTILRISLYYSFASFMSLIYNKADHLILSWMKGDYVLGQYGAYYRVMGALMGFVLIGTSVFVPHAAAVSSRTPERFGSVLHKGLLVMTVVSLPMAAGGFLFSSEIVSLVLGQKYMESANIFRVLVLIIPLGVSSSFFAGSLLFAPGHHRQYAVAVTLGAAANMLFNILLIPSMGAMGAAIATAFAQATVAGAAVYLGRHYLDKVFNRSLLHPFAACAVMVLTLTLVVPFGSNIILRLVSGSFIYAITLWMLDRRDGRELRELWLSSTPFRKVPIITG